MAQLQRVKAERGYNRLYWLCKHDDARARAVYDRLGAQLSDVVLYYV
jgi:RimJ/RimL family protein N-acetyltransferase